MSGQGLQRRQELCCAGVLWCRFNRIGGKTLGPGDSAVILRRGEAKLLFEAFGKIGRITETYFQRNLRNIATFAFNELCRLVQPGPSDQLIRRLTGQGYKLLQEQ